MSKLFNGRSELGDFKKFQENVIKNLRNSQLHRVNPIFTSGRYSLKSCGTDSEIFGVTSPNITTSEGSTINLAFLPDEGVHEEDMAKYEGVGFYYWIALLKEGIIVEQEYILVDYKIALEKETKIHRLEQAPFHVRLFCDVAKESLERPLVFIDDRLPLGLLVDVFTRYDYKRKKESNLSEIARRLLSKVNKDMKKRVEFICRNYTFKSALDEILKLSKQPIQAEFSYCLACGTEVAKEEMFCNSREVHGTKNPGNCRDKFHNWLRRRLGIGSLAAEREERELLYEELQNMIREVPFSAFETFQGKHRDLYDERRRGPKKRV